MCLVRCGVAEPTDLDRYRRRRGQVKTTVAVWLEDGRVVLQVGDERAELEPMHAMRLSNFIRRKASTVLRLKIAACRLLKLPGANDA